MNSACLIAACAVSKRQQNPQYYNTYLDFRGNVYYGVNIRMYIHFNPITIVKPVEEAYYGSYFAPIPTTIIDTVKLEAKTLAKEHHFTVNSDKCKPTIEKYVESRLNDFIGSGIWELYKNEMIDMYITDINKKYNIDLDKSSLDYSIQYVWEVDCVDTYKGRHDETLDR